MSFLKTGFVEKILQRKIQILWVIVSILTVYFIYYAILHSTKPSQGFASYYTSSRLLIEGYEPSHFYDDDWFSTEVERIVPNIHEVYLVNPPTISFIMLPLAFLDYSVARSIWIVFNLAILIFMIAFLIKQLRFEGIWIPFTILLILLFQPLYVNFAYGQMYVLIFCLLSLVWYAYNSSKDLLLGLLLGLVIILKTAGIFLIVLLVLKKKWRSLLWTFLTIFFLLLITLPIVGVDSWFVYVNKVLNYSSHPTLSVTAYQSLNSFFQHFTAYSQQWNSSPVINLPILGKILITIFSLFLLTLTSIFSIKSSNKNVTFGAFIALGIIIGPVSLDYHYILMLIPILITVNSLRQNPNKLVWVLFLISYVLMAVYLPYISPKITRGLLAVFAYPKLYGALIILVLMMLALTRSKFSEEKLIGS